MNYTLQLHGSNLVYPVPRGLHDLMADIAHEVLRHKPKNIEEFIFNYLDALMKIRRVAKGVAKEVDDIISTSVHNKVLHQKYGITMEEAVKAVQKMQAGVRGFLARRDVKDVVKKDFKMVSGLEVFSKTNDILKKYKLTLEQASVIATKIQAYVRGWLVRRKKPSIIPSHESWRHDWLWKEFQMTPEEVQAMTHAEKRKVSIQEDLIYQPRRSMDIDHIKFMKVFKGELADYDDDSEISSMEDITDELTDEKVFTSEGKTSENIREEISDNIFGEMVGVSESTAEEVEVLEEDTKEQEMEQWIINEGEVIVEEESKEEQEVEVESVDEAGVVIVKERKENLSQDYIQENISEEQQLSGMEHSSVKAQDNESLDFEELQWEHEEKHEEQQADYEEIVEEE